MKCIEDVGIRLRILLSRLAVFSSEEGGWSERKADSFGRLSTVVLGNLFLIGDRGRDLANWESLDEQWSRFDSRFFGAGRSSASEAQVATTSGSSERL